MERIKMQNPIAELDGDEMTRVIWHMIKEELILPFVDLKTEYYDLGLLHRNETKDQVTVDAANATKKYAGCGDGRSRRCDQAAEDRRQVRDHYAKLAAKRGVWLERALAFAQCDDPCCA